MVTCVGLIQYTDRKVISLHQMMHTKTQDDESLMIIIVNNIILTKQCNTCSVYLLTCLMWPGFVGSGHSVCVCSRGLSSGISLETLSSLPSFTDIFFNIIITVYLFLTVCLFGMRREPRYFKTIHFVFYAFCEKHWCNQYLLSLSTCSVNMVKRKPLCWDIIYFTNNCIL